MSIPLMALVWTSDMTDPTEVSVLACLASHANDEGESCFAGIPRIAKLVRRSERTVTRILQSLEEDGWLEVVRGDGRGDLTQYRIDVEKLKGCQDVTLLPRSKRVTLTPERVTLTPKKGDMSDNPPHPLFGRNLKANKSKPSSGAGAPAGEEGLNEPTIAIAPEKIEDAETPEFTEEQRAHLARLRPADRAMFEGYYCEENLKAIAARAATEAEAAKELELQREYCDTETALERVRKRCGFVWGRDHSQPLMKIMRQVLVDRAEACDPVWRTGPRMVDAWLARRKVWRYGPAAFFSNGEWMNGNG